jgi:C-terminal processing protease CtpA/Prc
MNYGNSQYGKERGAELCASVRKANENLEGVVTLPDFLKVVDASPQLTLSDQRTIVEQARLMFQEVYVNLQLKRAMHAVDPVQRLRLLERRLSVLQEPMPERKFHQEMISIFISLRDYHTVYHLPEPYRSSHAFLPFEMEEYFEDPGGKVCRYVVKTTLKVDDPAFDNAAFKAGAIIRYWNGIPIERAVELNAERTSGSNADARHSRGLETMTRRSLIVSLPPDEEWVDVTYEVDGQEKEVRLPWLVFRPETSGRQDDGSGRGQGFAPMSGIDMEGELIRAARVALLSPKLAQVRKDLNKYTSADDIHAAARDRIDMKTMSIMPDIIRFRPVANDKYGYIRIFRFAPPEPLSVDDFINEVVRILASMPENGLILDVRGNPGGLIVVGERLLQLFTPRTIETERLQFVNTPSTLALSKKFNDTMRWTESIEQSVETGSAFSQALPMEPADKANEIGQRYQGPVVLITDARCYSTTDIFAAGFEDNEVGAILGTSGNTGAGGANVWDYRKDIASNLPDLFRSLPHEVEMSVGVRRTLRAGAQSGVPLEDLGVRPRKRHYLTLRDVLEDNDDMIAAAVELLKKAERHFIRKAEVTTAPNGARTVRFSVENIDRVDVSLNGRPYSSLDIDSDAPDPLELSDKIKNLKSVQLRGFFKEKLVASCLAELH